MRKLCSLWLGLLGILMAIPPHAQAALVVTDLKCETRSNPLGIDNPQPCLGWILQSDRRGEGQSAYQILVAGSAEKLDNDEGDCWDSGKVASDASGQMAYRGKPLQRGRMYFWKARAWDKDGQVSAWSKPATWEMGLLAPGDWQAQWLNDGKPTPTKDEDFYKEDPAPLFRREFTLAKPIARARLYISGLGYYEASLNGRRVGDQVLDPGWTRYSKRVLYSTYDVTGLLNRGTNCAGVTLGNGWYNPLPLRMWGNRNLRDHLPMGRPRFIAQLEVEFTDGTRQNILSDPSWMVGEGPIRFNNIYLGEIYDARKEAPGWDKPGFNDAAWRAPAVAQEPVGTLRAQAQPPIRVTATLHPIIITQPKAGVFIYDMGRNFAGWASLKFRAPAGTKIILRYGELLNADGTLNPLTSVCGQIKRAGKTSDGRVVSRGGPGAPPIAWQSDTYIARGGAGVEHYTPRFTFHAFRYVEVTGLPGPPPRDLIEGLRLNSDVERTGTFSCSNELFNRIQEMCDWTFLSNLFSVESDCPHRERFGYGGDIVGASESFMMNYDMSAFYAKAVRDWQDSALADGAFTDTAPFVGIHYCGLVWAMAHPLLQRQLWQYYGEGQLIVEQYDAAKRWFDGVVAKTPDRIIKDGLSDHESLAEVIPPVLVTPQFAATARMMSDLAASLGRAEEAAHYRELAMEIKKAYCLKFFDAKTGKVGNGTQASQAFALYHGLLPMDQHPAALRVLLNDLNAHGQHLTTGILGTKYLLDVLSREGHADLAYAIANQKTFPGWGYMLENGATTLWEHWAKDADTFSHNHPMFGSVSQWFYQWLGGIQPGPEARGFDHIVIRPQPVKGLGWVRCSYQSVRGKIISNWRREGDRLIMEIEIPVNATARIFVQAERPELVREGGVPASQAPGVKFVNLDRHAVIYRVGSGHYVFSVEHAK